MKQTAFRLTRQRHRPTQAHADIQTLDQSGGSIVSDHGGDWLITMKQWTATRGRQPPCQDITLTLPLPSNTLASVSK